MCGIAGQLNFKGPVNQNLVKKMTRLLVHRGPDGEGFYFKDNVGLGVRRLAVIDLLTGDQPIHNQDKSVWLVFNGEIYNYQSLRKDLENLGYPFYTQSDTEVIVHLYEEYDENFVNYLDGMFAIALWDENKKKLILVRDRVGEKPLYYYLDSQQLLFASELKSILECPQIKRTVDLEALHHFLVSGRVPSFSCIIKNVKKLAPATMAVITNSKITIKKYWSLSFKDKLSLTETEIKQQLLEKFEKSVKSMMMADVPLGALLSGGSDSSAVVAMMARNSTKPVETFSVGFKEEDFSEFKYAQLVADKFATHHHQFIIEPKVMEILPKLVWHLDEPFADFSIIPTFYIAQAARKHLVVALTGDGGDELLAGYEWFKAIKIAQKYNLLPLSLRSFFYYLSKLLPETDEREKTVRYLHKIKRFTETQKKESRESLDILLSLTTGFTEELLRQEVYSQFLKERLKNCDAKDIRRQQINQYDGNHPLEAILFNQFQSLLPDMFFTKVDRCSMAASLETRAPFADRQLVEFAAKIPFDYKLKGYQTKYIFKQALKGILPDEILFRHKKGFTLPLNRWIKESPLRENIYQTLLDKSFIGLGFFNENYIKKILDQHQAGQVNNINKIWSLYMFALWYETYIKSRI